MRRSLSEEGRSLSEEIFTTEAQTTPSQEEARKLGFLGSGTPALGLKIVLELVGPEFAAVGRTDIPFEFEDDSPERAPERISET
jgi:hypothetical protein